jgi:ATP-dependent DNA helicase PIF1
MGPHIRIAFHLGAVRDTGKNQSFSITFVLHTAKNCWSCLRQRAVAALNVGGQTIHSFFKFPLGIVTSQSIKSAINKELYKAIDTIVIDEISMVRADVIDGIDYFMRVNGRDKKKPFGGVQMIFMGDLFQLPPVLSRDDEQSLFMSLYQTPYFFSASVFEKVLLRIVHLRKIFRQSDSVFVELLQAIRTRQFVATSSFAHQLARSA